MAAILCVKNDPASGATLDRLLREMGHEPHFAGSVSEAIAVLSDLRVDLVIVARHFPDRDALDLLDRLREMEPQLPCVVLPDVPTPEQAIGAAASGVSDDFGESRRAEAARLSVTSALAVSSLRGESEVFDIHTLERMAIQRALKRTGGHKAKAAELLGITERTLRNKLKEEALPVWVSPSDQPDTPLDGEEWSPPEGL